MTPPSVNRYLFPIALRVHGDGKKIGWSRLILSEMSGNIGFFGKPVPIRVTKDHRRSKQQLGRRECLD